MKYIWCSDRQTFVPADEYKRSSSRQAHIIRDTTEPFKSMADGKTYDSKSCYRRALKERGFVEIGNDIVEAPRHDHAGDIRRSVIRALEESDG